MSGVVYDCFDDSNRSHDDFVSNTVIRAEVQGLRGVGKPVDPVLAVGGFHSLNSFHSFMALAQGVGR